MDAASMQWVNLTFLNFKVLLRTCLTLFELFESLLYYSNSEYICGLTRFFYSGIKKKEEWAEVIRLTCIMTFFYCWTDSIFRKTKCVQQCCLTPASLTYCHTHSHSSFRGLLIYAWVDFEIYYFYFVSVYIMLCSKRQ